MANKKKTKKTISNTQKERAYYTDWSGEKFTKENNITNDFITEMTNGKGDDEPNE